MIAAIPDGARIMVGGFGPSGAPFTLIDELLRQHKRDLTLIKNDANWDGLGIAKLIEAGQVRRLISTHIGLNPTAMQLEAAGKLEVTLIPQGVLAERIRSAGAGIPAFLSPIGIGTPYAEGKPRTELDGTPYLIEPALHADFALIHAERADHAGNLQYDHAGRNFNPVMAMAATTTLVEAKQLVESGAIAPEQVHTPAVFVDAVCEFSDGTDYAAF